MAEERPDTPEDDARSTPEEDAGSEDERREWGDDQGEDEASTDADETTEMREGPKGGSTAASTGRAESTDQDAMGHDKRRTVVGQQYGATVRKRLIVYGAAVGVIVLVIIAFLTIVTGLDEREVALKDTAPWTQVEASEQSPPRDVDYKANGPTDTIPEGEIKNR